MAQSVLEQMGVQIDETARKASRAASAVADALEDGGKSVVSILMVVLLPAPLEPSKPNTSPALAVMDKESTAVNAPKRRVRVSISTIGLDTAQL